MMLSPSRAMTRVSLIETFVLTRLRPHWVTHHPLLRVSLSPITLQSATFLPQIRFLQSQPSWMHSLIKSCLQQADHHQTSRQGLSHREPHRENLRILKFLPATLITINSFLCQGYRAFFVHSTKSRASPSENTPLVTYDVTSLYRYQHPVGRGGKISVTHTHPSTTSQCDP